MGKIERSLRWSGWLMGLSFWMGGWRAELPILARGGDGEGEGAGKRSFPRVVLTDFGDVGKFVAAACELEDGAWEEEMGMIGDLVTVDEVVKLVEEVTASKKKIDVQMDGKEELERRVKSVEGIGATREEIVMKMVSQIEICMIEGKNVFESVVNRLCPHVKPGSVKEYLAKWWT